MFLSLGKFKIRPLAFPVETASSAASPEASMKRNFLFLLLISVLVAIVSLPAFSQTATVHGVVKDAQGNLITDAKVTWHNEDNGRTFTLKTNKKGEYFSLGIDPGKYTVTLTKDGKQLDQVKNYSVGVDDVDLPFNLKQSQEQQVAQTAKQMGTTPEQVKKMQEEQAKSEAYNKNIAAVNDKLKAATADEQANNYDGAIATLNEAAQMVPNEDLVWFRLGGAYLDSAKTQTDAAEKTKRYTEAYSDLQKAINLYNAKNAPAGAAPPPNGASAPGNAQGGQAMAPASPAKNPVQTAQDKQRLAAYYDNFANAAAHLGKSDDAVNAYNQAAELDAPHAGQYYFNLGAILTNANTSNDVNMRKQAVDAFNKAIAADPSRADAYFWKAQNLVGMATTDSSGKIVAPEGTAEAYQKYLDLQPSGPHADEAKQMLAALNAKVETSYGKKGAKKSQ
jgi:tetratricopeptide (TPR) repeat protein